jgi:hypothetical protein
MSITSERTAQNRADNQADADLERRLGDKLLFDLKAPQTLGGPSRPTLYRARDAGIIEFVKNGNRSLLTRATMKKILREGLGHIPASTHQENDLPPTD